MEFTDPYQPKNRDGRAGNGRGITLRIVPSAGELSKARYYSSAGTTGSFLNSGKYGVFIFYTDDATPTTAMGRIGHVCQTGSVVENGFNSNGTVFGTFGNLGLASGVLAWALPDVMTNNTVFSRYRAIVKMAEKDVVGDVTQLSYKSPMMLRIRRRSARPILRNSPASPRIDTSR